MATHTHFLPVNSFYFHFSVLIRHLLFIQSLKMPSSIIEAVPAVPLKSPAKAKVRLIAWDPESPAHTERMFQQRVACGWKQDYVNQWKMLQREGDMALQWVVSLRLVLVAECDAVCTSWKTISFVPLWISHLEICNHALSRSRMESL
jgi:hypothetical protein